jgi:hypothetical protein
MGASYSKLPAAMLALVLAASLASADAPLLRQAPDDHGARIGAVSLADNSEARLVFITERLQAGEGAARAWYWTWTTIYGAATIGQAIGFFLSQDLRGQVNWATGAATTLLGTLLMLVTDFPAEYGARELSHMPVNTPEQRKAKLKRAEELLENAASSEADGRAWFIHLGGAVVSIAGGLILWLAYGFLVDGIINTVAGIAVSEIQIWTQPTRAINDWREYQAQFGGAVGGTKPTVRVIPTIGGMALAGRF